MQLYRGRATAAGVCVWCGSCHTIVIVIAASCLIFAPQPGFAQAAPDTPQPAAPAPGSLTPPATAPQRNVPPPAQSINPAGPEPTALFEFHGAFFERYRDDTNHDNGGRSRSDSVTYGNTTVSYNPTSLFSAYVRFGFEVQSPRGGGRDYNTNFYQGDAGFRGAAAFDQYGVIYHDVPRGLTVNVGRQDEPLDASSTLYDNSYKVGLHTFFDGISAVQKVGSGSIEGYAFSEDQYRTQATRNGVYALRGTYSAGQIATFGATLAHFASSSENRIAGIATTTNYEGDVIVKKSATQVTLEYAKSNARTRNDLYYIGEKYTLTHRDSITVFSYKIAQNADVGEDSAFPNSNRGTRYFYEHFFSNKFESIFYYETDRQLYGPGKSTSPQVTLLYTF
ncbi:MAG: hypothetical protein ACRYFS_00270 [Janthinobacterium lividum]